MFTAADRQPYPCPAVREDGSVAPIDWARFDAPWVAPMAECQQDPEFHAEGDVWTHTKMVCEALVARPEWAGLSTPDRYVSFLACLFHDVAKPETRMEQEGHIYHPRHSSKGARKTRRILWEQGVLPILREQIVNLIHWHQVPFFGVRDDRPEDRACRLSLTTRLDLLTLVNRADGQGRICQDQDELLEAADLFELLCKEEDVWQSPYLAANRYARFRFASDPKKSRFEAAPDRTAFEVVLMSGLPGVGKDHFVRTKLDLPVISLDAMRDSLGIDPRDDQARLLGEARAQAKVWLRKRQSFVWNGTNLSRDIRRRLVGLFSDYGARVRIIYVEAPQEKLYCQNRGREDSVPEAVIRRLQNRWEVPDLTEAHAVEWHLNGEAHPPWPYRITP